MISFAFSDEVQMLKNMISKQNDTLDLSSIQDDRGFTLLHIAALNNQFHLLEFILNWQKTHKPNDPSHVLQFNNWVNSQTDEGFTPIHFASFRGNLNMIKILEENNADIFCRNLQGLSVIHIAAQSEQVLSLCYFQSRGVDINLIDKKGSTALHWACYQGCENSVGLLIHWLADVNQADHEGQYPLHLAVSSGNYTLVRKLLIKGADRESVSQGGMTPCQLAKDIDFPQIVTMLQQPSYLDSCYNIQPNLKPMQKNGTNVLPFLLLSLLCLVAKFFFIFPYLKQPLLLILDVIFQVGVLVAFLCSWLSDPGYLSKGPLSLLQLYQMYSPGQICTECEQFKPPRSKHCDYCHRCVSVFDHHCPWINNCVGAKNHFSFLLFLYLLQIFLFYQLAVLVYLAAEHQLHYTCTLGFTSHFLISRPNMMFAIKIFTTVVLILESLFFFIPITYLICIQTKNFLLNRTTAERYGFSSKDNEQASSEKQSIDSSVLVSNSQDQNLSESWTGNSGALGGQKQEDLLGNRQRSSQRNKQPSVWTNCLNMSCRNQYNLHYTQHVQVTNNSNQKPFQLQLQL